MNMTSGSVRPMAFDPKSPVALFLSSKRSEKEDTLFDTFFAQDGVGCNVYETSALLQLLDYRDQEEPCGIQRLSLLYRKALQECLKGWESRVEGEEESVQNLELMKLVYAICHLSEIYLLRGDTMTAKGSVTADTVRYLRLHHTKDAVEDSLPQNIDVDEMLDSDQPEYFHDDDDNTGDDAVIMTPYWRFLRKLVLRGCLTDAWAVLSRHSACRRCCAESELGDPEMDQDREAFQIIQAFLLSAPLPGGRDYTMDDGFSRLDDDDASFRVEEEEEDLYWNTGVSSSAYKLWGATLLRNKENSWSEYNVLAAMTSYKTWRNTLTNVLNSSHPLRNLVRRTPNLRRCLFDIVLGNCTPEQGEDSWSEALVAELLYVRPNIRVEDVHVRALVMMKRYGCTNEDEDEGVGQLEKIVLSVMKGNAGKAVQALHSYGGGSGAALPATVTALLCVLLTEAGRIPTTDLSFDLQTELLLAASSSILSSFANQSHSDVGVRMSTRLLRPHATPDNVRITAELAELLGRHWPKTDAEARSLLGFCEDIVRRGSRRLIDACDSIALCRYRYYMLDLRPGGAVHWLLRGMECVTWLPRPKMSGLTNGGLILSSCRRHLVILCTRANRSVLTTLVAYIANPSKNENSLAASLKWAQEIITSITEEESATFLNTIQSVNLLKHVLIIGISYLKGEDAEVACSIVKCLEEKVEADMDEEYGVVSTLAHPSYYSDFLAVATAVLNREDNIFEAGGGGVGNQPSFLTSAAFDVHSIHILMTRLTQITSEAYNNSLSNKASNDEGDDVGNSVPCSVSSMRLAVCKGLMRAFISENATKILHGAGCVPPESDIASCNMEQIVDLMLKPTLMK